MLIRGFDDQTLQHFTVGKKSYIFDQNYNIYGIYFKLLYKRSLQEPALERNYIFNHFFFLVYGLFLPTWIRIHNTEKNIGPNLDPGSGLGLCQSLYPVSDLDLLYIRNFSKKRLNYMVYFLTFS